MSFEIILLNQTMKKIKKQYKNDQFWLYYKEKHKRT